jgi:hypothetical protein
MGWTICCMLTRLWAALGPVNYAGTLGYTFIATLFKNCYARFPVLSNIKNIFEIDNLLNLLPLFVFYWFIYKLIFEYYI